MRPRGDRPTVKLPPQRSTNAANAGDGLLLISQIEGEEDAAHDIDRSRLSARD